MRLRIAFVVACIMLMATPLIVVVTLADSGTAPSLTTPDESGKTGPIAGFPGTPSVSIPPDTGNGGISIAVPPPAPMPSVSGIDASTMGSDMIGMASRYSGAFPAMPLVELPHNNGMNIISVPSGSGILPDGDIQYGSSVGHLMPPVPPGYWDNVSGMDLHTNMPAL